MLPIDQRWCHTTRPAYHALEIIKSKGDVIYEEDPAVEGKSYHKGLHTTIYYFCCRTKKEVKLIKKILRDMTWTSFNIHFDSMGCNLDAHSDTAYLHIVP